MTTQDKPTKDAACEVRHRGPWIDEDGDRDRAWFDCNDPSITTASCAMEAFLRLDDIGAQAVEDGCALVVDGPHEAYTNEAHDWLTCDGDTIPDEIPDEHRFEVYRVRVVDPPEIAQAHERRRWMRVFDRTGDEHQEIAKQRHDEAMSAHREGDERVYRGRMSSGKTHKSLADTYYRVARRIEANDAR